jgi:hypothetical protein
VIKTVDQIAEEILFVIRPDIANLHTHRRGQEPRQETGVARGMISTLPQSATIDSVYVPLWRVIEHVARVIGDKREDNYYATTRIRIRQAALDGKLQIRGRRKMKNLHQQLVFTEVHSDIPSSYWVNSRISVLATAVETEVENLHTAPETVDALEDNSYAELQATRDAVLHLWPSDNNSADFQ